MWTVNSLDSAMQDVRYGARMLRRAPGFTTVAVLSLAIGIGSAAAVFNVADAVLFRRLAVTDPGSLRDFRATLTFGGGSSRKDVFGASAAEVAALEQAIDFGDVIGFRTVDGTVVGPPGGDVRTLRAEFVSPDYFADLGVGAAAGRLLGPQDRGPSPVPVVITERLGRTMIGAHLAAGGALLVNGHAAEIVGVTKDFRGLTPERPADIFLPLDAAALVEPAAAKTMVRIALRLHAGVTPPVAEQKMMPLYRALGPPMARGGELRLVLGDASRGASETREDLRRPITLGLVLVAVLLIAACANTGGLLVAQFAARQTEFGVRVAIGAGRARLIRQLFVEALLLAALAGAAGLLIARTAAPLLASAVPFGATPIDYDLRFDWRLVAFTAAIALAAAAIAGSASLVPVFRTDPSAALKDGSRSVVRGRRLAMDVLIASQIACALLLLVVTGALGRTLVNLSRVDAGFDISSAIAFDVDASGRLADRSAAPAYFAGLYERIKTLPSVGKATVSQMGLLTEGMTTGTVDVPGWSPAIDEDRWVRLFFVGPGFFETLGMRMIAGESLGDFTLRSPERVAVVTREFARFYFTNPENAVGRIVNRDVRIVGVVADARYNTFRDAPVRAMFIPFTQAPPRAAMTLIVVPAGDPGAVIRTVTAAIRSQDSRLKVTAAPIAELARKSMGRERFAGIIAAVLALLAISLSAAGVYATVAYAISERRKELAIRFVLGASTREVISAVMRQPLRVATIGIVVAVPGAYALMQAVAALLFGVPPFDVFTVAASALALMAIAAVAAAIPAWRVGSIDPQECLRTV
jgi:putative ABC transport system permease protein